MPTNQVRRGRIECSGGGSDGLKRFVDATIVSLSEMPCVNEMLPMKSALEIKGPDATAAGEKEVY